MTLDSLADILNKLRIIPRLLTLASVIFFGIYVLDVTDWYMALDIRTTEESAFAASVITLLGGVVKFIIDKLIDTEKKND